MRWHISTGKAESEECDPIECWQVSGAAAALRRFWCNYFGKRRNSFLLNCYIPLRASRFTPRNLPKRQQSVQPQNDLHKDADSALFKRVRKWKQTRCPPITNGQTVVCYITNTTQHEEAVN